MINMSVKDKRQALTIFREKFGGLVNFDNEADDWFYPDLEAFISTIWDEAEKKGRTIKLICQ